MGEQWSDDPAAQGWLEHVARDVAPMIADSAVSLSLMPQGEPDVKFAVELGLSILYDKPIILAIRPGMRIPAHLVRVADEIVEISDPITAADGDRIKAAIARLLKEAS